MKANICPILGLTSLELFEALTILAAVGPVAATSVLIGTYLYQRRIQKKIDSARLVVELSAVYRTPEFRLVPELIVDKTISLGTKYQRRLLLRYLNHSNYICKLYFDGVITESDMKVMYSFLQPLIDAHDTIREFVEKRKEMHLSHLNRYIDITRSQDLP